MTTWLCVGASPLAPAAVERAHAAYAPERTIAANGAIRLFGHFAGPFGCGPWATVADTLLAMSPTKHMDLWRAGAPLPSVYFLSDQRACELYREAARAAQAMGTRCVTPYRQPDALRYRNIPWFDVHEPLEPYESLRLSGLFCAEYAARQGATRILMAGMDGYHMGERVDNYFFVGPEWRVNYVRPHTRNVIPQTMGALLAKYPAVEWVSIGEPLWQLRRGEWPNYRIESPHETAAQGERLDSAAR
jgi:hypothetical protein